MQRLVAEANTQRANFESGSLSFVRTLEVAFDSLLVVLSNTGLTVVMDEVSGVRSVLVPDPEISVILTGTIHCNLLVFTSDLSRIY